MSFPHHNPKIWKSGASLWLATALVLLVLAPATRATSAALPNGVAPDAVLWMLREMRDEAVFAVPTEGEDDSSDEAEPASTQSAILARRQTPGARSSSTQRIVLRRIARHARHLHEIPAFATNRSSGIEAPRFAASSPVCADFSSPRFLAAKAHPARPVLPTAHREYSAQQHSAAYRNGVRTNSFPQ